MLKPHPFADIFPMLDKADSEALRADIAAHGLREKVVLWHDEILDGRNRYRALVEIAKLGLPYRGAAFTAADIELNDFFIWFTGTETEALEYVLSKNLHRRHLNESQRAMVADRLATLKPGRPEADKPANLRGYRQADAAERLHVSERSVQDARVVRERGIEDINTAVQNGDLAVSVAAQLARLPVDEQVRLIQKHADPKALSKVAKELRAEKQAAKAITRREKERTLGAKQCALPDKRYGVILADPEWKFEVWSEATGMDRSPENHYPCSDLDKILSRDVGSIAADDAVLFLWGTAPMLPQALQVMAAWGFAYVTHIIWRKAEPMPGSTRSGRVVLGTGFWVRSAHEILLIGKRGGIPAPAMGTQWASVLDAAPRRHSEKPDWQYELIEALFPSLPKIELNARGKRAGWDSWGNEADGGEDEADEIVHEDEAAHHFAPDDESNGEHQPAPMGQGVRNYASPDATDQACQAFDVDPAVKDGSLWRKNDRRVPVPSPEASPAAQCNEGVALRADAPFDKIILLVGEVVAAALGVDASLKPGDSRLHTADERLIRRHVTRIACDCFGVPLTQISKQLGGSKQAAAQLRLAAIAETEADADLAAKLAKVPAEVTGRVEG